jgi:hypothetical protein
MIAKRTVLGLLPLLVLLGSCDSGRAGRRNRYRRPFCLWLAAGHKRPSILATSTPQAGAAVA